MQKGTATKLKAIIFKEKIARENVIEITLRNLKFIWYRFRRKLAHVQLTSSHYFHTNNEQRM